MAPLRCFGRRRQHRALQFDVSMLQSFNWTSAGLATAPALGISWKSKWHARRWEKYYVTDDGCQEQEKIICSVMHYNAQWKYIQSVRTWIWILHCARCIYYSTQYFEPYFDLGEWLWCKVRLFGYSLDRHTNKLHHRRWNRRNCTRSASRSREPTFGEEIQLISHIPTVATICHHLVPLPYSHIASQLSYES